MLSKLKLIAIVGLLIQVQVLYAEVIFVAELFRHGARSPSSIRLNFSRKWDVPPSSLTANGERMQYELGSYMRKTYIEQHHLLSPIYKEEEVLVISSRTSRTVQSAYSHLMGLYPPSTGSNITNPNLNQILPFRFADGSLGDHTPALPYRYQTIPVYTFSNTDDATLHGYTGKSCPIAKEIQTNAEETPDYKEVQQKLIPSLAPLASVLGVPESKVDMKFAKKIFSELHCAYFEGFDLPVKPHSDLWKAMSFAYDFSNNYKMTYDRAAHKAYTSPFLKDLHDVLLDVANASSTLKLKIYSSHDYQIINVLTHFNLSSWKCLSESYFNGKDHNIDNPCLVGPEFAAQMLWELHKVGEEYYVVMKYNNQIYNICNTADGLCPLSNFIYFLEQGILEKGEHASICGIEVKSAESFSVGVIFAIFAAIFALCFVILRFRQERNRIHKRANLEEHDSEAGVEI